jgi:hypothetical protein
MKELQYINFPVSFLRKRDLVEVLEQALIFCSYEAMERTKGDRAYFVTLSEKLGLTEDESGNDLFSKARELYNDNVKSIRCGVNLDVYCNYLRTTKDNLHIEFRAYCATKAILGKKVYKKTNYKEIFSFMFGYNCYDDISMKSKLELSKIENRRSMKKIIEKLEEKWHLSFYSLHSRGLYISYKLSPVDLIVEVKKSKIISKNKQKLNEQEADAKLLEFINKLENNQ